MRRVLCNLVVLIFFSLVGCESREPQIVYVEVTPEPTTEMGESQTQINEQNDEQDNAEVKTVTEPVILISSEKFPQNISVVAQTTYEADDNYIFYNAPSIIFSTTASENGLSDTLMYVKGTVISFGERGGLEHVFLQTPLGELMLINLDMYTRKAEWQILQEGSEYGFYFRYSGMSGVSDMATGFFLNIDIDETHESLLLSEMPTQWRNETFSGLNFDIPTNWRKESSSNDMIFFYPTHDNVDGFLYINATPISEIVSDYDSSNIQLRVALEGIIRGIESSATFLAADYIEWDLDIAGYYAVNYNYRLFVSETGIRAKSFIFITEDYIYSVNVAITLTSPAYMESVFYKFVESISVLAPTPTPEPTPTSVTSGYQRIYDDYAKRIRDSAPNVGIMELAEIANEGIGKMAEYMFSASGTDGQMATYESWASKLMDVYMQEAR